MHSVHGFAQWALRIPKRIAVTLNVWHVLMTDYPVVTLIIVEHAMIRFVMIAHNMMCVKLEHSVLRRNKMENANACLIILLTSREPAVVLRDNLEIYVSQHVIKEH